MTAGATQLSVCQRALADIGTRSTITSITPPDGSQEALYCNLYYNNVRDHILRAANWNFAKRTGSLQLWKALPGTPENPTSPTTSGWSVTYPAPPWTYAYIYPADCLRARALIGQPQQVPISPPIFSGSTGTNPPISQRLPMARFEIATDINDQLGQFVPATYGLATATINTPGHGYFPSDTIQLSDNTRAGLSASVIVTGTDATGAVLGFFVTYPGTYAFPLSPSLPLTQVSTSPHQGTGFSLTPTTSPVNSEQPVILTHQQQPLLEYTFNADAESIWDAMFEDTMVSALAARLAQVLTGDKALARDKITIANANIQNARGVDGNEGLTINDHIPDWIRVRGAGGGLGYETFFYPLGPLFPVAPLV